MTFAGAVVDLDGTVYLDGDPIDGALEGLERLTSLPEGVWFVSNNPSHSPSEYVDRLDDIGIETRADRILSSGVVTTQYLADAHAGDVVFVVGSDGLRRQLRNAGVALCETPGAADVLLASWTTEFSYDDLVDAIRVLEDDVPFYGTDPDRTFPGDDGRPIPGSGAIIRSVAETAERDPDRIFGKPSDTMVEAIRERITGSPGEYLVIGDRLETDVALGERAGMTTVRVRTGTDGNSSGDVTPDYVLESLGDIETVLDG
ncbi:HAD-IIA family hydrolase [Halapricum hydrolyticum]|uniref:HAD-IIA family hydrolase n=1 Tax=Halapricum hydrolyticum TaxID=2979991 RepID=A0AAE3ID07_9EURY|nr:HAD-IIA family hydrolase [Halapricum hydrolyticum]MCU4719229.1 HAD-IIA family hydrolase [Halapricum hydrolyticum]MCU4728338.1 HAD-IIA family hydrolase [Halapricum hydrolyticum]